MMKLVAMGVEEYPDGRQVCLRIAPGQRVYFMRLAQMMVRQEGLCALCGEWLGHDATFDHEAGRGAGGSTRDDRIEVLDAATGEVRWQNAAVHELCNGQKGSRRYRWVNGKYVPAVYASAEQAVAVEVGCGD